MNKAIVFGRRNVKEIMRSPVSWAFGLALPLAIFVIMQVIVKSIGDNAANVPMFGVDRFTGGVVIFGASFLSLFTALIVSGDRAQSFLSRLMSSPMTKLDFIAGYALGVAPIAVLQTAVTYIVALCFGLTASVHIIPAFLFSFIASLLFIAIGMIMGSMLSAKNAPPLCSVVVQVAALLSGMWFDLDMIGGGFNVFCHILPFAHVYDLIRYTIIGEYSNVWLPALVVAGYTVVLSVFAVLAFGRKK